TPTHRISTISLHDALPISERPRNRVRRNAMKNKIRYAVVGLRYIAQTAVLPAFEQAANSVRSWDFLATLWQLAKLPPGLITLFKFLIDHPVCLLRPAVSTPADRGGGNQRSVTKVTALKIAPSS